MSCTPSVFAHSRPCSPIQGGIAAVYVADPDALAFTADIAAGTVTLAAKTTGTKPFYGWEVAENASSLESSAQINEANNTKYFQHVLAAVLNGFDPTSAGADLLARLTRLAFVVKYRDGSMDFIAWSGLTRAGDRILDGAKLNGLDITSGTQRADRKGATITVQLDSDYTALRVNGDISTLINA